MEFLKIIKYFIFEGEERSWGWSDSAVVKSTVCSFRTQLQLPSPRLGSSQPSVIAAPGDAMPFLRPSALTQTDTYTKKH